MKISTFSPITAIVAAIAIQGCASSTGVVKIADDTYMLGKQDPNVWSGSGVKAELYKEGAAHCEKLGRKFVPLTSTAVDAVSKQSMAGAEIQFKCL